MELIYLYIVYNVGLYIGDLTFLIFQLAPNPDCLDTRPDRHRQPLLHDDALAPLLTMTSRLSLPSDPSTEPTSSSSSSLVHSVQNNHVPPDSLPASLAALPAVPTHQSLLETLAETDIAIHTLNVSSPLPPFERKFTLCRTDCCSFTFGMGRFRGRMMDCGI
jgi:hypothetical protein